MGGRVWCGKGRFGEGKGGEAKRTDENTGLASSSPQQVSQSWFQNGTWGRQGNLPAPHA